MTIQCYLTKKMGAGDDKLLIGLITFIGFCHRAQLHPEIRNQDWQRFRKEIFLVAVL